MNVIFSVFDSSTNSVKSNSRAKYYSDLLTQTTAPHSIQNKQQQKRFQSDWFNVQNVPKVKEGGQINKQTGK